MKKSAKTSKWEVTYFHERLRWSGVALTRWLATNNTCRGDNRKWFTSCYTRRTRRFFSLSTSEWFSGGRQGGQCISSYYPGGRRFISLGTSLVEYLCGLYHYMKRINKEQKEYVLLGGCSWRHLNEEEVNKSETKKMKKKSTTTHINHSLLSSIINCHIIYHSYNRF